ncbi:hypothetical protein BX666DRAFT_2026859 [Dichotomocladium elegans]|nr:hypothetical protein BX666DRAFT_2026859 [Dichotomocladium elegans]
MSPSRGRPRFQLAATIVKYACPCYNHCFDDLVNLGAHLDIHLGQHGASVRSLDDLPNVEDDNGFEPEDQPTIQEPLPTISPSIHAGNIAINLITINPSRRNFDEAVTMLVNNQAAKDVTSDEFRVEEVPLIARINVHHSIEQNALAYERVINNITADNDSILPILPLKHSKLIRRRQYVELSSAMCKLLNQDWEFHPQMRYFTAMIFFGAIMHNTGNGQAILVNTVEAYGRTKHCGCAPRSFWRLKDTVVDALQRTDGMKLLIGTQVSNVLITSSMRLMQELYLDSVCLEEALAILESPDTSYLSSFNMIYQRRQIRSKFDTPSNLPTVNGVTLADNDRGNNHGGTLFHTIGILVLNHGNAARLQKRTVEELIPLATGQIKELLLTICRVFPFADEDMAIINNQ